MSKQIDLAVIPGDGIGPEVVAEGLKVLRAALPPEIATIQTHVFSLGAAHYHKSGEVLGGNSREDTGKRRDFPRRHWRSIRARWRPRARVAPEATIRPRP